MKALDKGNLLVEELSASQAGRIEALRQQFLLQIRDWDGETITMEDIARHFAVWCTQVIDSFLAELFIQEVHDGRRTQSGESGTGEPPDTGSVTRSAHKEDQGGEERPESPGQGGGEQGPVLGDRASSDDPGKGEGDNPRHDPGPAKHSGGSQSTSSRSRNRGSSKSGKRGKR